MLGVNCIFALKCGDEEIGVKGEKEKSNINDHRQYTQIDVLSFCKGFGINNAMHWTVWDEKTDTAAVHEWIDEKCLDDDDEDDEDNNDDDGDDDSKDK